MPDDVFDDDPTPVDEFDEEPTRAAELDKLPGYGLGAERGIARGIAIALEGFRGATVAGGTRRDVARRLAARLELWIDEHRAEIEAALPPA